MVSQRVEMCQVLTAIKRHISEHSIPWVIMLKFARTIEIINNHQDTVDNHKLFLILLSAVSIGTFMFLCVRLGWLMTNLIHGSSFLTLT